MSGNKEVPYVLFKSDSPDKPPQNALYLRNGKLVLNKGAKPTPLAFENPGEIEAKIAAAMRPVIARVSELEKAPTMDTPEMPGTAGADAARIDSRLQSLEEAFSQSPNKQVAVLAGRLSKIEVKMADSQIAVSNTVDTSGFEAKIKEVGSQATAAATAASRVATAAAAISAKLAEIEARQEVQSQQIAATANGPDSNKSHDYDDEIRSQFADLVKRVQSAEQAVENGQTSILTRATEIKAIRDNLAGIQAASAVNSDDIAKFNEVVDSLKSEFTADIAQNTRNAAQNHENTFRLSEQFTSLSKDTHSTIGTLEKALQEEKNRTSNLATDFDAKFTDFDAKFANVATKIANVTAQQNQAESSLREVIAAVEGQIEQDLAAVKSELKTLGSGLTVEEVAPGKTRVTVGQSTNAWSLPTDRPTTTETQVLQCDASGNATFSPLKMALSTPVFEMSKKEILEMLKNARESPTDADFAGLLTGILQLIVLEH